MNFSLAVPQCPSGVLSVRNMPEYLKHILVFYFCWVLYCFGVFFLFLQAVTRSESLSLCSVSSWSGAGSRSCDTVTLFFPMVGK